MMRLVVQSCDDPSELYQVTAATVGELVSTMLLDRDVTNDPEIVATLLENIAKAMRQGGEPVKEFDVSSPECAYIVLFYEDAGDDDGSAYLPNGV
jgi:hypothetical protein